MGAPTAKLLQARGHRVVIMTRGNAQGLGMGGRRPAPPACEALICDRANTAAFTEALARPGCPRVVVDFTAMGQEDVEAVVAAHRQRPLQHYVFISTNMVYPGGPEAMDITALSQPVCETAAQLDKAGAAPETYGGRKLRCEAALQRATTADALPWTVLRPPAVVGPGCDNRHERLQRVVANLEPLPPRLSTRPATVQPGRFRVAYSEDVAAAAVLVVEKAEAVHGEAFNIASAEPTSMQEYVDAVARSLSTATLPISALPEEDSMLWNYQRQGSLDSSKAELLLGFKPTDLDTMINKTVQWHASFLQHKRSSAL